MLVNLLHPRICHDNLQISIKILAYCSPILTTFFLDKFVVIDEAILKFGISSREGDMELSPSWLSL